MISLNSRLAYAVCMAAASYLALSLNLPHGQALAQSSNLPPVTVDAPKRGPRLLRAGLRDAQQARGGRGERSALPAQAQRPVHQHQRALCRMSGQDRIRAVPSTAM